MSAENFLGYAGEQEEVDYSKLPLVVSGSCKAGDLHGPMRLFVPGMVVIGYGVFSPEHDVMVRVYQQKYSAIGAPYDPARIA